MPLRPARRDVARILVIRRRGLGDALLSVAMIEALASAYPEAILDVLIDRPFVPLVEQMLTRSNVVTWPPSAGSSLPIWIRELRSRHYDLVVDPLSTPRTALWTALSGARWRVGFDLRWRSWAYNIAVARKSESGRDVDQYSGESVQDLTRAMGLATLPWTPPRITAQHSDVLDDNYRAWRDRLALDPSTDLALVLSAGWPTKAWPVQHVVGLLDLARQGGRRCILVPGPGDDAMTAKIMAAAPDVVVAPPTGLGELADLLSRCSAYVGTDGGAQHVATVVGVPKVTLFGPTDALSWNRDHPFHVAVQTDEPCSPCSFHECPVPGHPCMTNIMPERVWTEILRVTAADGEEYR